MENYIGVSGNLRSQQQEKLTQDYTQILSSVWGAKPIWEHIRDNTLTAAPCMTGSLYSDSPVKLMFVGRAVNGWEVPFEDCSSLESTVHSVLNQKNRLDEFADDFIVQEDGSKYYYARSPFLRFMRKTVGVFHKTEENWQQRLIWSNLFKVAPRNGDNPSWLMVRNDIPLYRDILEQEIALHAPDLVVFLTDTSYFDCYEDSERYESFRGLLTPTAKPATEWKFVQAAGTFVGNPDVKIIVCCRPEGKAAEEMVQEIQAVYEALS